MKRKFVILILALTVLLSGCGESNRMFGIFYRAATDEEAFQPMEDEQVSQPEEEDAGAPEDTDASQPAEDAEAETLDQYVEGDYIFMPDGLVPLSDLPEGLDDGWILVRYTEDENGDPSLLWYRVWTDEGCWSDQSVPYEGTDWHPVIP